MARRSRWIGWTAACGVALYGLAGGILCEWALHPPRRQVPPDPDAHTVEIRASDDVLLRGSLYHPASANGGAVLVLHGIADSRASEGGLARMLAAHGYTVLAPDSRAQGESGGDLVTYGLLEADDVHRWVSWLIAEEHPRKILGLGESLGGGVLIESLAVEHRFSGIVAECSFASLARIARDRVAEALPFPRRMGEILAALPVSSALLYARLRYGLNLWNASPQEAIARSSTPVLLIHGLADRKTPWQHSQSLAAANPRTTTLWLVPGAGHTGAYGAEPKEFERRVLGFFAAYQNLPPGIQVREK